MPTRLHATAAALVALAAAPLPAGCRRDPPAYVHTLYVEAIDLSTPPAVRLRVRLVQADGSPAPAPDPRSVVPVASGRALSDRLTWTPVGAEDIRLGLVRHAGLEGAAAAAQAALFDEAAAAAGGADATIDAHPPPAPAGGPPMGRAHASVEDLDRAFDALEQGPAGGRRVVVVTVQGSPEGRRWNAVTARAVAADAELIVLALPRPGRRPPPPRVEHPMFVVPVDPAEDLAPVGEAVRQAIAGGMWASFTTSAAPVELGDGLALRARLPRQGWEEFGLSPTETPPFRVLADALDGSADRCELRFRVLDAADRPVRVGRGDVALGAAGAAPADVRPDAGPDAWIAVLAGPAEHAAAVARALVEGSGAADVGALVVPGGGGPDPPVWRPVAQLVSAPSALPAPPPPGVRDVVADLEELAHRWGPSLPTGRRATLVVLSDETPLRAIETVGGTPSRLHGALAAWRRLGAPVVWAAPTIPGRLGRFAEEVARAGGRAVSAAPGAPEALAAAVTAAWGARRQGAIVGAPCDGDPASLTLRVAWRGRTLGSGPPPRPATPPR